MECYFSQHPAYDLPAVCSTPFVELVLTWSFCSTTVTDRLLCLLDFVWDQAHCVNGVFRASLLALELLRSDGVMLQCFVHLPFKDPMCFQTRGK